MSRIAASQRDGQKNVVRLPMPNHPSLPYRPDIDGLRALAVLLVVVFHFHLVPGAHSGFMGVDVFFVISGFLITAIVQRQIASKTFRLSTFGCIEFAVWHPLWWQPRH
jgi:hypothetical protein